MTEETTLSMDVGALQFPAVFTNRAQVAVARDFVRLSFSEAATPSGPFFYRASLMMTVDDARALAETIITTIKAVAEQMAVTAPTT
jgi:hypothetical protein